MWFYVAIATLMLNVTNAQWVKQMENPDMYEGDMMLSPYEQFSYMNGFASTTRTWPKLIYYDWAPQLANNAGILNAIYDYEKYTCLRFHKRTNQKDYFYFFQGDGCFSGVGYAPGKQTVSIGKGCEGKATVIHEMAHRLGIYHEQSRPDRDDYITIMWDNIKPGMAYNFNKQSNSAINSYGTKYDYLSIMHYNGYGFSINGKATMVTKDPAMQDIIGHAKGFSDIDIIQLNRMYKCNEGPTPPPPKGRRPPVGVGVILRHSGGRCVAVNSDNQLYLTSKNCNTRFTEVNGGYLEVFGYNKCAQQEASGLSLVNFCDSKYKKTDIQSDGSFSIQKVNSANCFHPQGGSAYPNEGMTLTEYRGCSGKRLKFTSVKAPGVVLRHSGGRCVAVNSNDQLYLTSRNCITKFTEIDGGYLMVHGYNKCVKPVQSNTQGSLFTLSNGQCNVMYKKVDVQSDGSFSILKADDSGFCFHPQGGFVNPDEGTKLVQWKGCDGKRLKFTARSS